MADIQHKNLTRELQNISSKIQYWIRKRFSLNFKIDRALMLRSSSNAKKGSLTVRKYFDTVCVRI